MPMTPTRDFPSFASQKNLSTVAPTCTVDLGPGLHRARRAFHSEFLGVATVPRPRPVFLLVLDIALIEEELDQAKELVTSAWWQNCIPLN